jgi:hypothetical protein
VHKDFFVRRKIEMPFVDFILKSHSGGKSGAFCAPFKGYSYSGFVPHLICATS